MSKTNAPKTATIFNATPKRARKAALSLDQIEARNIVLQTELQAVYDEAADLDAQLAKARDANQHNVVSDLRKQLNRNSDSSRKLRRAIRSLHRKTDTVVHNCSRACCRDK